jgi:hypothetical protein
MDIAGDADFRRRLGNAQRRVRDAKTEETAMRARHDLAVLIEELHQWRMEKALKTLQDKPRTTTDWEPII